MTTPDEARAHRAALREVIYAPVTSMSDISRHPEAEQKRLWGFWLDTLMRFSVEQVQVAFQAFLRSGRRYVSPPDIVQIIEDERKRAARVVAQAERDAERARDLEEAAWRRENRVSAESAQAILEEYGFAGPIAAEDLVSGSVDAHTIRIVNPVSDATTEAIEAAAADAAAHGLGWLMVDADGNIVRVDPREAPGAS